MIALDILRRLRQQGPHENLWISQKSSFENFAKSVILENFVKSVILDKSGRFGQIGHFGQFWQIGRSGAFVSFSLFRSKNPDAFVQKSAKVQK